jgi:hypothetical protein
VGEIARVPRITAMVVSTRILHAVIAVLAIVATGAVFCAATSRAAAQRCYEDAYLSMLE